MRSFRRVWVKGKERLRRWEGGCVDGRSVVKRGVKVSATRGGLNWSALTRDLRCTTFAAQGHSVPSGLGVDRAASPCRECLEPINHRFPSSIWFHRLLLHGQISAEAACKIPNHTSGDCAPAPEPSAIDTVVHISCHREATICR